MKKNILILSILIGISIKSFSQITPEIYSWILNTNGSTGYNNIPSNIQKIQYSNNNVYVSATCIPGYDIGPWAGNPNTPINENFVYKITRNPIKNTGSAIATGLGHIGVLSNGVSIYNPKDAMSYNGQNVWHQNAIEVEGPSFDNCLGHPGPNGEYHHHLNPTCLYEDSISTKHSPIIGYAFDGFPVYGAFAYANTDGTGGIKRMQSSYQKRNMSSRTTLPDGSTASSAGPVVSGNYPLGYYIEDFINVQNGGDLDEHNGRFCVTPDYPIGMYCYFATLDSNLVAEYPYMIGPTYYGTVQAGNMGPGSGHNVINESVTNYTGVTTSKTSKASVEMAIFPNPAQKTVNISFEKDLANDINIQLINSLGEKILEINHSSNVLNQSIDISTLARGVYILRMTSIGYQKTQKLILN